jgi:hypothetical protein
MFSIVFFNLWILRSMDVEFKSPTHLPLGARSVLILHSVANKYLTHAVIIDSTPMATIITVAHDIVSHPLAYPWVRAQS